jgi:hypothetical protein
MEYSHVQELRYGIRHRIKGKRRNAGMYNLKKSPVRTGVAV